MQRTQADLIWGEVIQNAAWIDKDKENSKEILRDM